jgi:prepilin-type N-terminal cleavage/methylation domain-containing protein
MSVSNTNKQAGSTLIEILVAISVISLVLTAVGSMISMSIKLSDSNEQKQLALQKAQETLEFFRKERSINSWSSFSTPLEDEGTYCLSSLPENIASMSANLGVCGDEDLFEAAKYKFKREAMINFNDENSLKVEINLSWQDGSKAKDLSIEQGFENY